MGVLKSNKKGNKIKNLPEIALTSIDDRPCNIGNMAEKYDILLILYFHPECEFCNLEIVEILQNITRLTCTQIVLVANVSVQEIHEYLQTNSLSYKFENVWIVSDEDGSFVETFDIESTPTIFIYGRDKKIIKYQKGFMSFRELSKYLNEYN